MVCIIPYSRSLQIPGRVEISEVEVKLRHIYQDKPTVLSGLTWIRWLHPTLCLYVSTPTSEILRLKIYSQLPVFTLSRVPSHIAHLQSIDEFSRHESFSKFTSSCRHPVIPWRFRVPQPLPVCPVSQPSPEICCDRWSVTGTGPHCDPLRAWTNEHRLALTRTYFPSIVGYQFTISILTFWELHGSSLVLFSVFTLHVRS